jgi:hypothetical protein
MAEVRLEREEIARALRQHGLVPTTLRFGPLLFAVDETQLEPESLPLPAPTGVTSIYEAARGPAVAPDPTVYVPLVKRDRSDEPMSIGRALDNDVILRAMTVSKRHATVRFEGEGLVVRDLGSTRGTFVGGRRIGPGEAVTLVAGATFRIGDVEVRVVPLADLAR